MALIEDQFLFLDTETTGLKPGHDEVIEIASILTDLKLNERARIDMKVQFDESKMSEEAAKVNNYDPEVWKREAKPFKVWKDWLAMRVPRRHVAIAIGHNVGFDRDMINFGYYAPEFCPISYHKIDTVAIAGILKAAGLLRGENLRLETVMRELGLGEQVHSAMGDVLAVKAIFERAIEIFRAAGMEAMLDGKEKVAAPKEAERSRIAVDATNSLL